MKNVMQLLLSLAMVFALASCAQKKDESSAPAAAPVVPTPSTDFYGSATDGFGDFEALKSYFNAKSFADGIAAQEIVYHVGPDYGMQLNGGSFNVGFCINIFGNTIGNCDNLNNNTAILENIVNNGEYKIITSVSQYGVSYDLADRVENDAFVFEPRTFDANSEVFIKMLNLDNSPVLKVVVSPAEIRLNDGTVLNGDLVEYFYGSVGQITDIKRYVLAKDLPLIANPIANFDAYGVPTGALNNIGNKLVSSVTAMAHNIQYNVYTNQSTIIQAGPIGITLN